MKVVLQTIKITSGSDNTASDENKMNPSGGRFFCGQTAVL
jgi:hypothetical protein